MCFAQHAHTPPDPSIPMPMSERYFEEAAQDTAKSATWWSGPALRPTFGGMCLPVAAVLVVLGSLCFQLCVEKVASICAKRIPKSAQVAKAVFPGSKTVDNLMDVRWVRRDAIVPLL